MLVLVCISLVAAVMTGASYQSLMVGIVFKSSGLRMAKLVVERIQLQHGARDRGNRCRHKLRQVGDTVPSLVGNQISRVFRLSHIFRVEHVELRFSILKDDFLSPTFMIETVNDDADVKRALQPTAFACESRWWNICWSKFKADC